MGGSGSKQVNGSVIEVVRGSDQQRFLKEQVMQNTRDGENFYDLFGLQKYCDMNDSNLTMLNRSYKKTVLKWHPDKNPPEKNDQCTIVTEKLNLAKQVLSNPELKRRYDNELKAAESTYSHWDMYVRWGWTVGSGVCGVIAIVGGISTVNPALGVAGSALLGCSMATGRKNGSDPDCSGLELTKDAVMGALIGAASGGIGVGAGAAMKGASWLMCVVHGSWAGAASYATAHAIRDTADFALTELGLTRTLMISDSRSRDEIFTADNLRQFFQGAAVCAVVGGVLSGAVAAIGGTPDIGEAVDDAAQLVTREKAAQAVRAICSTASVHGSSEMYHTAAEAVRNFSMGAIEKAKGLVSRLERRCCETLIVDATEVDWVRRNVLDRFRLTSTSKVLAWVNKSAGHISFDWSCVGTYRSPKEIVETGKGVCMEFATLACFLCNLVKPRSTKIAIGLMRALDLSSCHAWVEIDGTPYEPQSAIQVDYQTEDGYRKWFQYDESGSQITNPQAYSRQAFACFIMGGGVVRYHPSKQVVGLWSDSSRQLVVEVDLSVRFEWSKHRLVSSLQCGETTWSDDENCLKFDVTFPADAHNPDGRSHWHLYTDGSAKVTYDREMPNGARMTQWRMTRKPFPIVGIWEDNTRRLRVSEDRKEVSFLWSRVRDVSQFSTKKIVWDRASKCLSFDLHFPQDESNPDGLAHWKLSETGDVTVTFDRVMPNGCTHSSFRMQRQEVSANWLDRFKN